MAEASKKPVISWLVEPEKEPYGAIAVGHKVYNQVNPVTGPYAIYDASGTPAAGLQLDPIT